MPTSRRDFLRASAVTAGALGLGLRPAEAEARVLRPDSRPLVPESRPTAPLKILVLGGTSFIGPHQVRYAMERGHTVTLFNRGKTNTQLFPELEKLHGDRATGDLESLKGRTWDAVIDNSASNPDWVRDSAQLLKDRVKTYLFISTRSVYRDLSMVPATKDAPVYTRETTKFDPAKPLPYGLAKAESEKQLRAAYGDRSLVVRPGLIIGPGDDTDRFSYWPIRIDRGGEILAPGDGSDPVQIIDARDLAEWCIRLLEQGTHGTFNAIGPKRGRSFMEFLYGIAAVCDANVDRSFTWVDTDFLIANRVRPYAEMPVFMPARGDRAGFARFDITPEIAAGLTFRPLAVTAEETLEYHRSRPAERQAVLHAGLTPDREKEVLALWRARKS
jgi:2'-hydroxyisoflavone reductase